MKQALSRIGINLYAVFLSFLAGCAVGIWSGVAVALFARAIAGALS